MQKEKRIPADQAALENPRWKKPTLKYVGNVGEVFLSGGGKVSTTTHDTGDTPFKPPGQG
jgi:hypothetical protein